MMKYQTTRKQVKLLNDNIIAIGYENAGALLKYKEPYAYTAGIYGWNADIYEVDGLTIVTGYRPFGDLVDRNITNDYNTKALRTLTKFRELRTKDDGTNGVNIIQEEKEAINNLLSEYITAVKEALQC